MVSRDAAGPGCDGLKKIPAWMLRMTMTEAKKAGYIKSDAAAKADDAMDMARLEHALPCGGDLHQPRVAGETTAGRWWCALCLEDFEEGDEPKTMPCSHAFHPLCILGVLRIDPFCPECQSALPPLEEKPSTQ
uniref:RING-type E3 ubiquitin transferase n=1 Tax=Leersia perrieri TaxID=77586 RepID=A0A0D9XNZ3_9ORYZ